MIVIYCKAHHEQETNHSLCNECQGILDYALKKIELCPQMDNKPTCERCSIHCYRKEERETIRNIMRYAGPRMMFKHPIAAIVHIFDGLGSKNRSKAKKE